MNVLITFHWSDWRKDLVRRKDPDVEGITLDEDMTIQRVWAHVPREGEHVVITHNDQQVIGNVRAVHWIDGHAEVYIT